MVGTPEFMAPEVVTGEGHNTDSDRWGWALLCELLTLHTPFRDDADTTTSHQRTYANIIHGQYTPFWRKEQHPKLSKNTQSLIDGLCTLDPANRLGGQRRGVESLRVHPFFWGLSWEELEQQRITPPHAKLCAEKVAAFPAFPTSSPPEHQPKPLVQSQGSANELRSPGFGQKQTPKPEETMDAAAAALDKLFDFSEWGIERE